MEDILKKIAVELGGRINSVADHSLDVDSKILALVTLLERKGLITFDEFDKEHDEVYKQMKGALDEMKKHKVEKEPQ